MYLLDEEKDEWEFDGDLTEYLLQFGVSAEHIDKMKNKILVARKDYYHDFEDTYKNTYKKLVPLNKVIGVSRGTVGDSVYENVRKMKKVERKKERFEACFEYLEKMPLEELKKSYEKLTRPVKMVYYECDDEYFLTGDGNHRTLTAMLVGSEYILAKVTRVKCDLEKRKKFIPSKEIENKYNIVKLRKHMCNNIKYSIVFKDDEGEYTIYGYPMIEKNEDFFEYLKRIDKTLDNDLKKINFVRRLPKIVQNIILIGDKNNRVKQYITRYKNNRVKQYITRYKKKLCDGDVVEFHLYDLPIIIE